MKSYFTKQGGFGMVGLLLTVVVIAALAYGGSFFLRGDSQGGIKQSLNTKNQAESQINAINQITKQRNEQIQNTANSIGNSGQPVEVKDLEKWQTLKREHENFTIKFHQDWYYDRDEANEKKLGYKLYIGFGESPAVLAKGAPYPIELLVVDSSYQIPEFYNGSFFIVGENGGLKYILKTDDEWKYGDVIQEMEMSFEFIEISKK